MSRSKPHHRLCRLLIDSLESRRLFSSVATKLADINQTTSYLDATDFTSVGTSTFFTASSFNGDGLELWITDGTTAGTRRVKDINPGVASSNATNLFAVGSTLYFSADDGTHGAELWKSDGTEAGTTMVADLNPGSAASTPGKVPGSTGSSTGDLPAMVDNNGTLFFVATDASGPSLFKTDGTATGTSRWTTSNYYFAYRSPLAVLGGSVYFGAASSSGGYGGLYRTDTGNGVPAVVSLHAYSSSFKPANLTVMGGKIYFSATQFSTSRSDLWVTDGSSAGTTLVTAVGTDSSATPTTFRTSGSLIYFVNYLPSAGKSEFWRTDGSATGTYVIASGLSTSVSQNQNYNRFVSWGTNQVFFPAGGKLYRSAGTVATTYAIAGVPSDASVHSLLGGGGRYYVLVNKPDGHGAIYSTDGSTLTLVQDLATDFIWDAGLLSVSTSNMPDLLFDRTWTASRGDLWRSSGTSATTVRVGTANDSNTASSMLGYYNEIYDTRAFTAYGTSVLFTADDGIHGREIWIADPLTRQTRMFADVNPGPGSSNPVGFVVDPAIQNVYFSADTSATGIELFRVTPAGVAQIVSDIAPGALASYANDLRIVGSSLYFRAQPSGAGTNSLLYRYDLTGSSPPIQVTNGSSALLPGAPVTVVGGTTAIVSATTVANSSPSVIYLLNGASTPTSLASGVSMQPTAYGDKMTAVSGGYLYFIGSDATHGSELWRTDGTSAGTAIVADVNPGTGSADIRELIAYGGRIFFAATGAGTSPTLWSSDGTSAGTLPLAAAAGITAVSALAFVGNTLDFIGTGADGIGGVYRLGGIQATTLPRIYTNTSTASAVNLINANSALMTITYNATPLTRIYSLYQTNEVTGAMSFVKDIWTRYTADPLSTDTWGIGRLGFIVSNSRLLFAAFQPEFGYEPFSYPLTALNTHINGTAYFDQNHNGTRDSGEPAASGASVFIDLDNDGVRDNDEPAAVVDSTGAYTFAGLEAATYTIRLLTTSGLQQSEPAAGVTANLVGSGGTTTASEPIGVVDTLPPSVTSIAFDKSNGPVAVVVTFSKAIDPATLSVGDLTIASPSGVTVATASMAVNYDATTHAARFTFPGYANGLPPNGWYAATFNGGGVGDLFGNLNAAASSTLSFRVLAGDVDDNGSVDFNDLLVIAKNYNTTGKTFAQGNLNFDAAGNIDFDDLLLLAKNYNLVLGTSPPAGVAAAETPTRKRAVAEVAEVIA